MTGRAPLCERLALDDEEVAALLGVCKRTVVRHMRGLARNVMGVKRYPRDVVLRVLAQSPRMARIKHVHKYQRGDSWYLSWYEAGRSERHSLGPCTAVEAEAHRFQREAELRGVVQQIGAVTTQEVIAEYLAWCERARPTSFTRARSAVRRFVDAFGSAPAESIAPRTVEAWELSCEQRGAARHAVKVAKTAFRHAIRMGALQTNLWTPYSLLCRP